MSVKPSQKHGSTRRCIWSQWLEIYKFPLHFFTRCRAPLRNMQRLLYRARHYQLLPHFLFSVHSASAARRWNLSNMSHFWAGVSFAKEYDCSGSTRCIRSMPSAALWFCDDGTWTLERCQYWNGRIKFTMFTTIAKTNDCENNSWEIEQWWWRSPQGIVCTIVWYYTMFLRIRMI
jgi:hypothetical protein